jgi:hypothetical protein
VRSARDTVDILAAKATRTWAFRALERGELAPVALDRALRALGVEQRWLRYRFGVVPRPNYAYGVRVAAELARRLGHPGVTVVELGVAGGVGLIALEQHARHYSRDDLTVAAVGFDRGAGLPPPSDYRDLPHLWTEGYFEMDERALRARLRDARLVVGDVRDTIPAFLDELEHATPQYPIGFVAFDLDYWSSTAAALDLFERQGLLLPRVVCYFDDVIMKIEDVGPMLAIREFNDRHDDRKIRRPFGLRAKVPFQPAWAERIFEAHFFEHPAYTKHVTEGALQRPLGGW